MTTYSNITYAPSGQRYRYQPYYGSFSPELKMDVHVPSGTAPANGWPTIVFVHGGRFVSGSKTDTNENGLLPTWRDAMLSAGYAVVAPDYTLSREVFWWKNIFQEWYNYNNGVTHPTAIKDIKLATRSAQTSAGTWSLDPNKFFISGHSAGCHIALMAALTIGDTATYTGYSNDSPNQYLSDESGGYTVNGGRNGWGQTATLTQNYQFNYRTWGSVPATGSGYQGQAVTDGDDPIPFKGAFLYAPATRLSGNFDNIVGAFTAVKDYLGRTLELYTDAHYPLADGAMKGEGDIASYINPAIQVAGADTIYKEVRSSTRVPDFPIAITWSASDEIIYADWTVNPIWTTLGPLGVPTGAAQAMTANNTAILTPSTVQPRGLTRIQSYTGTTHANVQSYAATGDFVTWARAVLLYQTGGASAGGAAGGAITNRTYNRTGGGLSAGRAAGGYTMGAAGDGNYDSGTWTYDDLTIIYDSPVGRPGTSYLRSGYGLSGAAAGGADAIVRPRAGGALAGAIAGGGDAVACPRAGGALAGTAAGGGDLVVSSRTGGGLAGAIGNGAGQKTVGSTSYPATGGALAAGKAGGQDTVATVETGGGSSTSKAGGQDAVAVLETGGGRSAGVAGGAKTIVVVKTGGGLAGTAAVTAAFGAVGNSVVRYVETGGGLAGSTAGGAKVVLGQAVKTGGASAAGTAGGAETTVMVETGGAVAGGKAGGQDAVATVETGGALAGSTAGGAKATQGVSTKTGYGLAGATGGGAKLVTSVETGGAISRGTAGATEAVSYVRTGGGASTALAGGRRLLSWESVISGIDEASVVLGDGYNNLSRLDGASTYETGTVMAGYGVSISHGAV